jgi:hypothetical protein
VGIAIGWKFHLVIPETFQGLAQAVEASFPHPAHVGEIHFHGDDFPPDTCLVDDLPVWPHEDGLANCQSAGRIQV